MLARFQVAHTGPEITRDDRAALNPTFKPMPVVAPDYKALRAEITAQFSKTLEYLAK
jgi:hypothetical protein